MLLLTTLPVLLLFISIYYLYSLAIIFSVNGLATKRSSSAMQTVAVNSTSVDEFNAVSAESCKTPIITPTATTCIARSLLIPNMLQASGINSSEPPATPDAPQAQIAATRLSNKAVGISTGIPKVFTAASVKIVIVIAAPHINGRT